MPPLYPSFSLEGLNLYWSDFLTGYVSDIYTLVGRIFSPCLL